MPQLAQLAAALALAEAARAIDPEQARYWLAQGQSYAQHPQQTDEAKAYLAGDAPAVDTWPGGKDWETWLIEAVEKLKETGVEVDDHRGTPIGEGESIGLVAVGVQMDAEQLQLLPAGFQTGLFAPCSGSCPRWPAAVRVSHTKAVGLDLMRIALSIGHPDLGPVNLLFTETLKGFPIADKSELQAFAYQVKYGPAATLLKFPEALARMAFTAAKTAATYGGASKQHGAMGKDYHSLTPYLIGGGDTASAMKWRLVPAQDRVPYPEVGQDEDPKSALRQQLVQHVSAQDFAFDLEIQVATDPDKQPLNDAAAEWDEETAPWVRMGTVTVPKQAFPSPVTVGNVVGKGLWAGGSQPDFNSKELLFAPGQTPHRPLGDINVFRADLYPTYDQARQIHLLQKAGGQAVQCPFKSIADWLGDGGKAIFHANLAV